MSEAAVNATVAAQPEFLISYGAIFGVSIAAIVVAMTMAFGYFLCCVQLPPNEDPSVVKTEEEIKSAAEVAARGISPLERLNTLISLKSERFPIPPRDHFMLYNLGYLVMALACNWVFLVPLHKGDNSLNFWLVICLILLPYSVVTLRSYYLTRVMYTSSGLTRKELAWVTTVGSVCLVGLYILLGFTKGANDRFLWRGSILLPLVFVIPFYASKAVTARRRPEITGLYFALVSLMLGQFFVAQALSVIFHDTTIIRTRLAQVSMVMLFHFIAFLLRAAGTRTAELMFAIIHEPSAMALQKQPSAAETLNVPSMPTDTSNATVAVAENETRNGVAVPTPAPVVAATSSSSGAEPVAAVAPTPFHNIMSARDAEYGLPRHRVLFIVQSYFYLTLYIFYRGLFTSITDWGTFFIILILHSLIDLARLFPKISVVGYRLTTSFANMVVDGFCCTDGGIRVSDSDEYGPNYENHVEKCIRQFHLHNMAARLSNWIFLTYLVLIRVVDNRVAFPSFFAPQMEPLQYRQLIGYCIISTIIEYLVEQISTYLTTKYTKHPIERFLQHFFNNNHRNRFMWACVSYAVVHTTHCFFVTTMDVSTLTAR
jgi:uncharacterized protein (UPF0333 family)